MLDLRTILRRVGTLAWCIVLCAGAFSTAAQDRILITEFMAANTKTVMDRDRQYSDWIELYNAGTNAVSLEGWHLTDDRENLKKWRFPASSLAPGDYLLVFASGKDRRLSNGELHTNFKLDAAGEYLALVKPDGRTVASEYATAFPAQMADVSYGLQMSDRATPLAGTNAAKRVLVPTRDIGMNWTTTDFDDRAWKQVGNGVGFDPNGNYTPFTGENLRDRMLGKSTSAYLRIPFVVSQSSVERLKLRVRYDDGFVAYLNGWEVARRNAPKPTLWNSPATNAHGVPVPAVLEERFESSVGAYALNQANSTTRSRVSSANTGSTGRFLRLTNGRVENQANSIAFPQLAPVQFESVNVEYDFRHRAEGRSGYRLVFLMIPVAIYGTNGPGVDLASITSGRDTDLPGVFSVALSRDANSSASLAVYWNRSRQRMASISGSSLDAKSFHRISVRIEHTAEGAFVTVSLATSVNSGSGARFTPVDRLFVRGLQPFAHRVQFAARITDWNQVIDLDNVNVQLLPRSGLSVEEIDLPAATEALRPGTNLLAVHGMNLSADDPTFLLQPELVAASGTLRTLATRYFAMPTPRGANLEGFAEAAPPPIVVKPGGVFRGNVEVTLKSPATNGIVRFTLNGAEPTAASDAYTRPIAITACVQLKAKTFVPDRLPSATVTETYTLLEDSLADFNSNLPLVILNPFGKYISSYNKVPTHVRVIDAQGGRAALTGAADYDGPASINVRGFSTLNQPKNSFTLHLRDGNGDKQRVSLLGMPKDSDWILYAPYCDKTLMRDALAYDLSNKMGRYAPRTRFVEVYLHRYGAKLSRNDYHGVYVLEEKITRGKNRVNVQELSSADNSEPAITGGYIIKRDHSKRREANFDAGRATDFFYVYPEPEDITREQKAWIARYMHDFERALYGQNFTDPAKGYAAFLDVDSFIDHHWLVEMSKNIDGLRYSAFMHKDRGGKLVIGPAWDWNLSWGNASYQDGWKTDDWYFDLLRETEICWFRRLSDDPEFMQRAIDRWGALRRGVFNPANIHARVDEWAALLNEAQARNFKRWPVMGRDIHPNYYVGSSFQDEVNWMKQWIRKRIAWIDSQFVAPPEVSQTTSNDPVVLRAPRGKVYYTLDGTDPRLRGGAINSGARVYKDPIPANEASRLFARSKNNSGWSAPFIGTTVLK